MGSTPPNLSAFTGIMSVYYQNGVGERSGSLFSSRSLERFEDFNKDPERPKELGVNQHKDYAPKSLRADSNDVDDGSLPCTPQSDSDTWSAENEALTNDTRQLVSRFLAERTGLRGSRWNESKALTTMKRVVDSLLEKHRYTYNGMIRKLQLDDKGDDMGFISGDVAKNIFSDGITNWGHITSLVAFGAVVAKYQKENGKKDCVELVAQEISSYLLKEQREWLIKNNSWDGFVEFFREADPESTVWNTLMTVVGDCRNRGNTGYVDQVNSLDCQRLDIHLSDSLTRKILFKWCNKATQAVQKTVQGREVGQQGPPAVQPIMG